MDRRSFFKFVSLIPAVNLATVRISDEFIFENFIDVKSHWKRLPDWRGYEVPLLERLAMPPAPRFVSTTGVSGTVACTTAGTVSSFGVSEEWFDQFEGYRKLPWVTDAN